MTNVEDDVSENKYCRMETNAGFTANTILPCNKINYIMLRILFLRYYSLEMGYFL